SRGTPLRRSFMNRQTSTLGMFLGMTSCWKYGKVPTGNTSKRSKTPLVVPPVPGAAAGRFVVSSAPMSPAGEEDGGHLGRRKLVQLANLQGLAHPELSPPVERLGQGARVQPEFSGQAVPRVSVKRHDGPQPPRVDSLHFRPPSPSRSAARSPGAG